jgi:hypothetical protein
MLRRINKRNYICGLIHHKISPMKLIIALNTIYLLVFTQLSAYAQKENVTENEILLKEYLQKNKFDIDSTAQAIVLYEKGSSWLADNVLEYRIERTIKFLGDGAINDLGVINIPYNYRSSVTKIEGTTYNLEGGKIIVQSLDGSEILKERMNENVSVSKFNLPGIKKGSIIHYSYSIFKRETLLIPDWDFQNDYPTLYSEYNLTAPAFISYNSIERLSVPMRHVKKKKELVDCESCSYSENFGASSEANHTWVRRNILAFKSEPYMSSPDNFRERVKINIVSIQNNGYKDKIFNNWEDFTKKFFYKDKDFAGQVFSGNNFLSEKVEALIANQKTELEKAQAIFSFVRSNITLTKAETGSQLTLNIKDIFTRKTGNIEGINLLLTAMLRKAGLDSEPIVLSTKDNERLNMVYVDPGNINYLASKLVIDKKVYLLDASNKYYPFNVLPYDCYNGYCRTISENGGSSLTLDPDSIKNKTTIIVKLVPSSDSSKLLLKVDEQYGVFSAIAHRNQWAGDTAAVRKSIAKGFSSGNLTTSITDVAVKNLTDPDVPLNLHYEMLMNFDRKVGTIYLDPFFSKFFAKNPFPSGKRMYTVEMDYLQDINYILRLELPQGYVVDDYPKSAIIQYGDEQVLVMKNIMEYDEASRIFSLNSRFISKTTLFPAEDYESLRNFYGNVIEEQGKKLIIKKVN